MNLFLSFFSLSILIISSNALQCQNGGVALSGVCVCPVGYTGHQCQFIECGVHGVSAFPDKCACEYGWVGKFCNVTKETICQRGELTAKGECLCHRNWMGPRCTTIVCKGSNAEIVDWECKCRYSGTYPDCNNKFPTKKVVIWSSVFIVCVILLVIGHCCCNCSCNYHNEHQQQLITLSPPPAHNESPPTYTEAVAK